jgi:fibronectin type 3 domain-containing protein
LAAATCVSLVLGLLPHTVPVAASSPSPCPQVPGQPTGGSPRLMVVGDSISQGSSGDYTWRYRLYKQLVADGVSPQMVGPSNWLINNVTGVQGDCAYADPAFENAHDAVWGRQLADEKDTIQAEVTGSQPDYLLVLIGINDLAFGVTDVPGAEANLKAFVANARAANPDIRIVLGELLPKANPGSALASEITQYNADLPTIASQLSTSSSPVVMADDASAVDPSADLWDGTHPNANGEVKIAAGFLNALASNFGLGAPYPTPLPTLPVGPLVPPQVTATVGDGQAVLSWTLSPGADTYVVYERDATNNQTGFMRLPIPLPTSSDPWTAGGLVPGATYQFEVRAAKGLDEGAFSNAVTVTPTGTTPGAATGLTATSGDGQAVLSWTAATAATGYLVSVENVTAGETAFTQLPFPVTGTSWTAGSLVNGATYQFQLQSVNGLIKGGSSNTTSVTPTGPTPAAPAGLAATPGDGQAVLTWTPADHATAYNVFVENVTAGETAFTQLPYPVVGSTWTAGELITGETYQFELQSLDGIIPGGTTTPVQVTPTANPPPAPTGLTATPGDGQAVLSWTPASGADGYYVYTRNVTAGDTGFTRLPYPVAGATWTAGLLTTGATYQFELQSVDGIVAGGISDPVQVTPTAAPPPAPTSLAATAGSHSAKLTWTAAPGATAYLVSVKNVTAGDTAFTTLPYPVAGSTWTASGLANGASYQFELQSVDGLVSGGTTAPVAAAPTGPAPAAPTTISATAGDGTAVLTWSLPQDATCVYLFMRESAPNPNAFSKLPYPVCDDEFTAGSLVNGVTYQFEAQAYDDLIPGGTSSAVTVTPVGPAPAGAENLTAMPGNTKVTLRWDEASHATSYNVWQKQDTFGVDWTELPYPVAGNSVVLGSLVDGAQYEYKIQSVDGIEPGGFSSPVTVTPRGPTPQAPGDLAGTGNWQGTASLTWSNSPTATGYLVSVSDNGGAYSQLPYPVSGGSWTTGSMVPGHTYSFKLQAVNGLQPGTTSNVASVTIPLPPAPTGLSASVAGANDVRLSWNPVWGADGYYIHLRDVTAGGDWTRLQFPVQGTVFTAHYLVSGDTYDFAVTAEKFGVEGGLSADRTARPMPPLPPAPKNLQDDGIFGDHTVSMSWTATSSGVLYVVHMRDDTVGSSFQALPYPLSQTEFVAGQLATGHTYEFYVTADNLAGESPPSNTITVTSYPPDAHVCDSVANGFQHTSQGDRVATWNDPTMTICGTRSGDTFSVDGTWSTTNGKGLMSGAFRYMLIDCTTDAFLGETDLAYDHGTSLQSPPTPASRTWSIDRTHYYSIRATGDGALEEVYGEGTSLVNVTFDSVGPFNHPDLAEATQSFCF